MLVVNIFGGPGIGKSTTAAGIYFKLKALGHNCEYVHEWIKWSVWEDRKNVFDDQMYIFAKQHHMLHTLRGQVDVAITDSPLLLSEVYGSRYAKSVFTDHPEFFTLVHNVWKKFENINYVLERPRASVFEQKGRKQNEKESIAIDVEIESLLNDNNYSYKKIQPTEGGIYKVVDDVEELIGY
jgi:hypothetical protein